MIRSPRLVPHPATALILRTSFLVVTVMMGWCSLCAMLPIADATAAVRQLEEAPGQVVYQSRQALKDQMGDRWQLIAFNRVRTDGHTSMELRIVGFPGSAQIDRERSLLISPTLGPAIAAPDTSSAAFSADAAPQPHIGQYDLQIALSQLAPAIPARLTLPLRDAPDRILPLSPKLIQEWRTVADSHSLNAPLVKCPTRLSPTRLSSTRLERGRCDDPG
ncbi:MAG: DUF3122 domain-containing protein [Leptolyngbyaceae cyanobacterium]